MLNSIETLKNTLGSNFYSRKNTDDLISYLIVQDFVKLPSYFPITSSSLRFHTLLVIFNDIILNKRKSCIEFGSGISTLALSSLIKNNQLNCKFFSIEDNEEWFNFMKLYIEKNNLAEFVNLVYAPLEKTNLALEDNLWYAVSALDNKISKDLKFDLVIIDGPGAWKPEIELSRYAALPYLVKKLAGKYSVYLDDINRKGERKVINLWQKEFKIKFEKINSTTAVYTKGSKSNIIL